MFLFSLSQVVGVEKESAHVGGPQQTCGTCMFPDSGIDGEKQERNDSGAEGGGLATSKILPDCVRHGGAGSGPCSSGLPACRKTHEDPHQKTISVARSGSYCGRGH